MSDPSVKKQLKTEGLAGACDKFKMNPLSKNFFVCLAENGRYNSFESVISTFKTIMSAHRGEIVCEVTTAKVRNGLFRSVTYTTTCSCSHGNVKLL